jgi:MFS family permease
MQAEKLGKDSLNYNKYSKILRHCNINKKLTDYLPSIFISLGLGRQLSLMIGGIESTLKIGCTIIEMLIIDRAGRRTTLIIGCIVMGIALLVRPCSFLPKVSTLH